MTAQDQINEKNVCLVIKGGNLTARTLALAMKGCLRGGKRLHRIITTHRGKQTVRQLARQGATLANIEIKDENIKSFESVARKYGIDFAVRQDISDIKPKYLIFFKSRDADAMTAAFKEFSAKQLGREARRPSIMQMLQRMLEKVRGQVLEKERHRERER